MSREPLANWNGTIMPLSEVRVSVLDRGFLFGDAIYEVLRVYCGVPFLESRHLDRLERNLNKLSIRADVSTLASRMRETLDASGISEGTIYIQVTRGEAPRSHAFPDPPAKPNELIWVREYHDHAAELRRVGGKVILIPDLRWKRCDIKSVNLLANCMGAEEARQAGAVEAIYFNDEGWLSEGTHTSLFAVRDGAIITAPLGKNLLPGITRTLVLDLASRSSIPVIEESLHRDQLTGIDELFLTGTTTEIMPIVQADETLIGHGQVGPVVRQLQTAYGNVVAEFCRQNKDS